MTTNNVARADAIANLLLRVAKASKKPDQMPVYDANGKLVGLCAVDDLQPVAQGDGSAATPASQPAPAPTAAQQPAAQEAVEGVTKAIEMAHLHPDVDLRVEVRKAGAAAGATLTDQFDVVLKSMHDKDAQRVQDAVGWLATHLTVAQGIPHTRAVSIAKSHAIRAAQAKAQPKPDTVQVIKGRLQVAGR